ncbi:MAG TPA: SGNH/GDSL hydrolase family protein [Thermoanaerobaculia bacterium]|nr:SGNH/GDSL hydrolase family protein [Thermoanaerobaculia bacterium]
MQTYIALGDSISIDIYPAHDVQRRYPGRASTDRLGAASLFFRNDDRLWPEFRDRDLQSFFPAIDMQNETADGATTHSLLAQVSRVTKSDAQTLITVTAGGNDLLGAIGSTRDPVRDIFARLNESVVRLAELRPNATILIGTVYDPSDGTNVLPGSPRPLDRSGVAAHVQRRRAHVHEERRASPPRRHPAALPRPWPVAAAQRADANSAINTFTNSPAGSARMRSTPVPAHSVGAAGASPAVRVFGRGRPPLQRSATAGTLPNRSSNRTREERARFEGCGWRRLTAESKY